MRITFEQFCELIEKKATYSRDALKVIYEVYSSIGQILDIEKMTAAWLEYDNIASAKARIAANNGLGAFFPLKNGNFLIEI